MTASRIFNKLFSVFKIQIMFTLFNNKAIMTPFLMKKFFPVLGIITWALSGAGQILDAQTHKRLFHSQEQAQSAYSPKTHTGIPSTLRVLALRVQFRLEEPDFSGTTGNGHFDLRDLRNLPDSIRIDPPPHDKRYFEDQLEAMKNYFSDVSDGLLDIQCTVKPHGMNDAYTLNQFMYHYGITGTQSIRDIRLAKLLKDAVTIADTTDNIDFSQYDYVIVFHAGVGQDFSNQDNTPNDIASRFISYDMLKKYDTTASFDGIPVNNGSHKIRSGVIVPETESQYLVDPVFQVDVFQEIGLSGILIANFGSQLGMPDLFNTANGRPAIGMFGLEDQGAMNANGLIPSEPDPWTKIYMGWASPVILTDSANFHLYPRKLAGQNTVYKLPINDYEYFLIENRQKDVVDNNLFPVVISKIDTINENGTTIIDTVYMSGVEQSPLTKVITRVDEYDSGLPGSGVLIWHIDERVIRNNWSTNSINNDPNNRGIRLVEGSGSQDIGYAFSAGPFVTINSGDRWDFFFKGNNGFKFYNNRVDSVFFNNFSVPNSLGKHRVFSGISLSNFSARQPVMSFDVRNTILKKGFPQYTGATFGNQSLAYGNISGDNRLETIIADPLGKIYAWQPDGRKVIDNALTVTRRRSGGDSTVYPLALFASLPDSFDADLAVADLDGDGLSEVISVSRNGLLTAWKAVDANADGLADTMWQRSLNKHFSIAPIITPNKKIIAGSDEGTVFIFNHQGQPTGQQTLSYPLLSMALLSADTIAFRTTQNAGFIVLHGGAVFVFPENRPANRSMIVTGDIAQDGRRIIIDAYSSGNRHYIHCYPAIDGFPVELNWRPTSPLSLADIDGDGFLEIIFGADNKIYALNHNGTLVSNFPVTLDATNPAGIVYSTVLVADMNNDHKPDLVAASDDGRVFAYDAKGKLIPGFPLSTGYPVRSSMAVFDIDRNQRTHLAAPAADGFVYVWDAASPHVTARALWTKIGKDSSNSSMNTERNTVVSPDDDWMPKKKAYCYPNPAKGNETKIRYYLSEPAEVKIKIYDLAGDRVARIDGPGIALTDNEALWNLSKIRSGVYFAKIEAKSSSGKKTVRTIRIAVTK